METNSCSNAIALSLSILLHFLLATFVAPIRYDPVDFILLDCGSTQDSRSLDGRIWQGDTETVSDFIISDSVTKSQRSRASEQNTYAPEIPYWTAQILFSELKYSFPSLSPGPKFLRLYFYPATYILANNQTLNKTESFFSVKANQNTLLCNFSAFLTLSSTKPSSDTLIKEYIIHINDTHPQLNITFLPNSDSYAFINGIEIVSMPNDLYFQGNNVPLKTNIFPYYLKNDTALETHYRLNVGGVSVSSTGDTGMFRTWSPDEDYIPSGTNFTISGATARTVEVSSEYTAPEIVYTSARIMNDNYSRSYNMTWVFPVDSGFHYLLRLHFCEFFLEITKPGDRIFSIFINNEIFVIDADVISWAHGPKKAVCKDYVAFVADPDGQKSKQDLSLTMKPSPPEMLSLYDNALLNGLEIFKISRSNGSLNSPNPNPVPTSDTSELLGQNHRKNKKKPLLVGVITAGTVALLVFFVGILILKTRRDRSDSVTPTGNHELPLIVNSICRHFSFDEMKNAACNFDDSYVIGVGGFGSVYKGFIDNGLTEVAIKRLNPSSNQGIGEFWTEIEMLSKLRHLHLVSLNGYCYQKGEMILVYDYMSRGTLRDHLYNTKNPRLPWKRRLQICVGVARGLHYLHTGSGHTIIHRDIKSTNILLDENWVAKVSDFGLSKIGPINGSKYHISTMVKGSFGYLDPEYFLTQRLTDKSDVYSFGVVLLEVLCACPAITRDQSGEHINLVDWARLFNKDGTLDHIIDPTLKGEIASDCLTKYVEITFKCLERKGAHRPAMPDVVWNLEFALQLQEDNERSLSVKMTEERCEAGPSVPIVHHSMAEPDASYSGYANYSLSSRS